MTASTGDVVLAHHALLFAIPVLVPTFVVVALVVAVVVRDRMTPGEDPLADDEPAHDDPRR